MIVALPLLVALTAPAQATPESGAKLVSVEKIWDAAKHNAFTDLVRFHDRWFCVFREGDGHVSKNGSLRVLTSADGQKWESAALISSPTGDLRDAKITVTPDDRLMLSGASALHQPIPVKHQSYVWFSKDGHTWDEGHPVGDPNFWLWRVTWHKGKAYGIGYATVKPYSTRLYESEDGINFRAIVPNLLDVGYPNESSILFLEDDTALCLLRRDEAPDSDGLIGRASPPYTEWTWKDLGARIGGPQFVRLPDGRFVAAVRLYDGKVRTSLCWLDPDAGELTEFLPLPSGGDTSYPGMVVHDGQLWVSYYSSHEGKTSIYLARVEFPKP